MSPQTRSLETVYLAELLPRLEELGYVERRVGERLAGYRLSPLGRRTLHSWIDTRQWPPEGGQSEG
ncbi:hypothetical protein CVO96_19785 [Deinococcus koreensis]|uniref:HTH hxlR-type domain-containing protein n=2 Tax=Deinococcus koreensis TaxID=2054903 RepID=A0A2K3US80_9DEIO|nr:hypothetical protein CVO96_19785 [Deinococcus koreensis]